MKFAVCLNCAADWLEKKKEDSYNEIIDNDPCVQATFRGVEECLRSLEQTMNKGGASAEEKELIDEAHQRISELVVDVLNSVAEDAVKKTFIIYRVGLFIDKLKHERKAAKSKPDDKKCP